MNTNKKLTVITVITVLATIVLALGFYIMCLNHVEVNELGVVYDSLNGEITTQDHPGWYFTGPFKKIAHLDLLPQTVHIPTDAKVINTKIVRFKPEGIKQYIELHGFGYDLGQSLNSRLMGYAFSGKEWPFLEVCQEGGSENMTPVRK